MANGSAADNLSNLADFIEFLDQADRFMRYNTKNFVSLRDALNADLVGNRQALKSANIASLEAGVSSPLSPSEVKRLLAPYLADVVESDDIAEQSRGYVEDYRVLRDWMRANNQSVKSRSLTYGSVSAGGSNKGSASVYIITEDSNGDPLEGVGVEPFTLEVIQTRLEGRKRYAELWGYTGVAEALLNSEVRGTGLLKQAIGDGWGDDKNLLANGRFQTFAGTRPTSSTPTSAAAVTDFTSWVLDSITGVQADADQFYKPQPRETSPISVRLNAAARSLTQTLITAKKSLFERERPYLLSSAYRPQNSADGSFRLDLGAYNNSVALSGSAWARLAMPLNYSAYFRNWGSDDEEVTAKLSWVSPTQGQLYLADARIDAFVKVNNFWIVIISEETAGAPGSAPAIGDVFTATFSEPGSQPTSRGVNQYWLSYRSGVDADFGENEAATLPSDSGGYETIPDAS